MSQPTKISELFTQEQILKVPAYQRAYAWEDLQLDQFLGDIEQHPKSKPYFFGTFLLEHTRDTRNGWPIVHIVDGQQRLTTLAIFFQSVIHHLGKLQLSDEHEKQKKLISRKYIFDHDANIAKFETIDSDLAFYYKAISSNLNGVSTYETLSQKRLQYAYNKFVQYWSHKDTNSIFEFCEKISSAHIIQFKVASPGEATQIFELQNDRGKKLTHLESLKAYLMHRVYLVSNSPDQNIRVIQGLFERIFRSYERIEESTFWSGDEDDILTWYAIAFTNWAWWNQEGIKAHSHLKNILGVKIQDNDDWRSQHISQILEISGNLEEAFNLVLKVLSRIDTPQYSALSDLFALNKLSVFWPLLIKLAKFQQTESEFEMAVRTLEIFCMRAYAIVGMKSGSGEDEIFKLAREFNGNYTYVSQQILNKAANWRNLQNRFESNLDDPEFYYQGSDARYFFWRYENYLRSQPGQHYPKLGVRDLFSTSTKSRFSIEHIAAQKTDDEEYSLATIDPYSGRGSTDFREKYLHSIGNLVIDCHSPNASKGNSQFPDKVASYQSAPLVSQNELRRFASKNGKELVWDKEAINRRKVDLISFALKTWNANIDKS